VVTKNTFLHVEEQGHRNPRRRESSAPPSSGHTSSHSSSRDSSLTTLRSSDLKLAEHSGASAGRGSPEALPEDDGESDGGEDDGVDAARNDTVGCAAGPDAMAPDLDGEAGPRPKDRTRRRPNKAKRDKFNAFVSKIHALAADDPENFNMDRVDVPPSIAKDPRTVPLLREKLAELIPGLPGLFSSGASSSQAQGSMLDTAIGSGGGSTTSAAGRGRPLAPGTSSRQREPASALGRGKMKMSL